MSETSANFNVDDSRETRLNAAMPGISRAIRTILYMEQQPEYEQGSLEAYEEVFDKSKRPSA